MLKEWGVDYLQGDLTGCPVAEIGGEPEKATSAA